MFLDGISPDRLDDCWSWRGLKLGWKKMFYLNPFDVLGIKR